MALPSHGDGPTKRPAAPDASDVVRARTRRRATDAQLRARVLALADLLTAAAVLAVGGAYDARSAVALAVVWPVLIGLSGGYTHQLRPSAASVVRTLSLAALVGVALAQIGLQSPEPRRTTVLSVLVLFVLATLLRLGARLYRAARGSAGIATVAVGDRAALTLLAEDLEDIPGHGIDLRAVVVVGDAPGEPGSGADLGAGVFEVQQRHGLGEVVGLVEECGAIAVLAIPSRHLTPSRIRQLSWSLESTSAELLVSSGVTGVVPGRTVVTGHGDLPVLHVRAASLHGTGQWVKECWERTVALLALLALAPLLAVAMVAVRLDSPGPALYRQVRLGRGDRPFTMYKLRTMVAGADAALEELAEKNEADGPLFKLRQDPRITRLGRLLRRYSIDELPQLWNIVRGDMALVGPRPPLPDEVASYDEHTHRRMAVKPGLTGLWQVSGRSDLSWRQSVRLDLHYVDNWSLALDLRIVLRTASAVLSRTGAY